MADEKDKDRCLHPSVTCDICGAKGTPAQMIASRPRKRGPEAAEQSRQAARKRWEKKKPDTEG